MKRFLITAVLAAWASFASPSLAANVNIDGLPAASSVAGANLFECLQSGSNRKCTAAQIAAYVYGLTSGDATVSGVGAVAFATVNGNVGSFGSATQCATITVNAKGLITAASAAACTPAIGSVSGLGTNIAAFLATPSSANLRAALTDEVGTGASYFVGGALGTPASGTATNLTGLPIAGITGFGTGVATALGNATNGSGGLVTFGNAVTSITGGCGTSTGGSPITTTGALAAAIAVRTVSGTSDTVLAADCGNLVNFTNAGSVAVTLPQAGTTGFAAQSFFSFCSHGAGTTTITPTTSTIGGAATKTLVAGTPAAPICTTVISDGTNYQLVPSSGGSSVSAANPTATASDTAVNGVATTFMRSDAAPPIQKGSNAQFGLAEGDGASIDMVAGVVSRRALTGDVTASAGSGATTLAAGSASNLNSGTLNAARMPALTGNCTTSAGAVATTCLNAPKPRNKSGNFQLEWGPGGTTVNTSAIIANIAYVAPIWFPEAITIQALGLNVVSLSAANNCQIAIYSPDGTDPTRPGALVMSSQNISTASAVQVSAPLLSGVNVAVGPGMYFKATVCSGTPTLTALNSTSIFPNQIIGASTMAKVFATAVSAGYLELSVPLTFNSGASFPSSMSPSGSTCGTGAQACTYTETVGGVRTALIAYQLQ